MGWLQDTERVQRNRSAVGQVQEFMRGKHTIRIVRA